MKKILFIFIYIGSFALWGIQDAYGAEVFFQTPLEGEIAVSQEIPVEVRVNADQDVINAVDIVIEYSSQLLQFKQFIDGGSVIALWVDKDFSQPGKIILRGIIPQGLHWQGALVGVIQMTALQPGKGIVRLSSDSKAYLNDGQGTEIGLVKTEYAFSISQSAEQKDFGIVDTYPPEAFEPLLFEDPNLFENRKVLVFATQDKQSTIDHYEIQETTRFKPRNDAWTVETSPYALKDQERNSYIFVKAVDVYGNERIEMVYPKMSALIWKWSQYLGGAVIVFIVVYILWRRRRKF